MHVLEQSRAEVSIVLSSLSYCLCVDILLLFLKINQTDRTFVAAMLASADYNDLVTYYLAKQ